MEDGCQTRKRRPDIRFIKAAKGRRKKRALVSNKALFPFCLHGFYEPEQVPTMKESVTTTKHISAFNQGDRTSSIKGISKDMPRLFICRSLCYT
jgi:hypothetical protein